MTRKVAEDNERYKIDYFKERVKSICSENLKFVYGLAKGISLAASTIVIISILISPKDHTLILPLLTLINSWLVIMITHDAVITGTLFFIHIPKAIETIITFMVVCFEFLLFATCNPDFFFNKTIETPIDIDSGDFQNYWFLLYGLYTLCSTIMIIHAKKMLARYSEYYDKSLTTIIDKYLAILKLQFIWTLILGISCVAFYIYIYLFAKDSETIKIWVAVLLAFLAMIAFYLQQKSRNEIDNDVYPKKRSFKKIKLKINH